MQMVMKGYFLKNNFFRQKFTVFLEKIHFFFKLQNVEKFLKNVKNAYKRFCLLKNTFCQDTVFIKSWKVDGFPLI